MDLAGVQFEEREYEAFEERLPIKRRKINTRELVKDTRA